MKIYIGNVDAASKIRTYCQANEIKRVTLFGDPIDGLEGLDVYQVPYKESSFYRHYYKYLSFTDANTLFVWRDCLITQKRHQLEYNCIRQAAAQTQHRLIFNSLPVIKNRDDFLTLYELIQASTFVRMDYANIDCLRDVDISDFSIPKIEAIEIPITDEHRAKYESIKQSSIAAVKRDANIIPRRCLKYAEGLAGEGFDTKTKLLPRDMRVSLTGLKVDSYFYNELLNSIKEVEYVVSLVQR